ncbi:MAG: hypothetical protein DDT37_01581 [Firmicutes bacterium]|nr:hypothetical protein [candidate division NPL-UPA2 bacterium]
MKLIKTQITNYRCIDDSQKFTLNQITCLVGKNESGKTVLLRAIEKLNALNESETVYNKTQDYPRRFLTDYKERHGGGEARVAWTVWRLEQPEIAALKAEFGPDCLGEEDEITVTKSYEQIGTSWTVPTKTAQIVEYLARKAGIVDDELKEVKPHLHSEVGQLSRLSRRVH